MSPRSAPYLWVQLINGGALPLEALLLLLLLAGADPGPLPVLEQLLAWALGAAAPALLLWHRPADPRSLLLLSGTGPLNRDEGLMRSDVALRRAPRALFAAGVLLLLPLLSWLDGKAALASQLSPLQGSERLVCLMAASGLLALMVWQWQQLVQAIWLLSQDSAAASSSAAPTPVPAGATSMARNLGLPLLRWPSLEWPAEREPPSRSAWALASSPRVTSETLASNVESQEDLASQGPATVPLQSEGLRAAPEDDSQTLDDNIQIETIQPDGGQVDVLQSDDVQSDGVPTSGVDANVDQVSVDQANDDQAGELHGEASVADLNPPQLIQADEVEQEVLEAEVIDPRDSTAALPVEPEQPSEHNEGHDLDQQIG